MTIEAKVIADSIGPKSPRLTTLQLKYPRFIHAEFMTHRVFSRNASSSRAIPVEKQIEMIREDTAMPVHWGKNQSGMQAREECNELIAYDHFEDGTPVPDFMCTREEAWEDARDNAIRVARLFHAAGYHKQIVNRILEPFSHISVVVTATDFDNFFWLRRHEDAQPEIKALADKMYDAMNASVPRNLSYGEWHLPYVTDEDRKNVMDLSAIHDARDDIDPWTRMLIQISVARCARVSYLTHEGKTPDIFADMKLHERLVGSEPLHASPAEHQARPDAPVYGEHTIIWGNPDLHGNLTGYQQYRKMLPGEFHTTYEGLNAYDS